MENNEVRMQLTPLVKVQRPSTIKKKCGCLICILPIHYQLKVGWYNWCLDQQLNYSDFVHAVSFDCQFKPIWQPSQLPGRLNINQFGDY